MITSNKLILTTKDVIPTNTYKNLISGKTSAVIIQNFLTKHRCKKIIRDIAIYEASSGCGLKEKIGESINSYVSNKSEYFTKTKISNYYLRKIFFRENWQTFLENNGESVINYSLRAN